MPAKQKARNGKPAGAPAVPAGDDPIKHVVVLMLENRSFDQMLGALQEELPDLDGCAPRGRRRSNADADGRPIEQAPVAVPRMKGDPKHELPNALHQLENRNGNFVLDFARAYPHSPKEERQQIMAYFPLGALPAIHTLAREFTVCDRWFSSIPGATWPNRLYVHSGTSIGRAEMPHGIYDLSKQKYDQDTLYDRLNEREVPWKIYFGDMPQSMLLMHQWKPENVRRYRPMEEFYRDCRNDPENFPAYAFIEPRYYAPQQNDDHPPHDVSGAQRLIADVYNALHANVALWESTLLVITYDEHGGFYDHVQPPPAVPPDDRKDEYTFDRYGVRVPAVLVSPWVDRKVEHTLFDHTSILKYCIEKWGLGPLGERAAQANSIGLAIRTEGGPRKDVPAKVEVPKQDARSIKEAAAEATELNELQQALSALAMFLGLQKGGGDPAEVLEKLKRGMENPAEQVRFTTESIRKFIQGTKAAGDGSDGQDEAPRQRVVVTKRHEGKGGQGGAGRRKVTVKKLRHETAEPGLQKGKTRLRPT